MKLWLILIFLLTAAPAHAALVGAAISAIAGAFGALSAVGQAVILTIGRLVLSAAVAAYQKRRMRKKLAQNQSGIKTQFIGTGGTTALTVIVGRYATNGHLEAPQMSQPDGSSPPNAYLTYVIGLGDMPIKGLTGRLIINDQWATLSQAPATALPDYGTTVEGPYANRCWFRFHDGSQVAADPWLITTFGGGALRPWTADMVGRGIPYIVATFDRVPELFPGEPRLRFEVLGLKLYDPRKDSSVGGSGPHRWSTPSTWEFSENPKVIEYNILRGLRIDGFGVWGGNAQAEDLPLSNWFAAMNACDVLVDNGSGGTEPAYVFGFEFSLEDEPRQIIDEINRSCGGETVEIGGVYKTRVGGVGLPVYFMTDGDILVSRPQELEAFTGFEDAFNAVSCSFPDPSILWEAREAPPLTNAAWELEDGSLEWDSATSSFQLRPRRLLREVSLPGVANPRQVQRLMSGMAAEGRKNIRHVLTLPPEASLLEPLDAVAWTSSKNGYDGKVFEVVLTADPVTSLRPRVGLLEADPSDYATPVYRPLPAVDVTNPPFGQIEVEGFDIEGFAGADAFGQPRYPAVRLFWNGAAMAQLVGIAWELRVANTGQIVRQGSTPRPMDGQVIVDGILPATLYQARVRPITDRPTDWSQWKTALSPDLRMGAADLSDPVQAALVEAEAVRDDLNARVDDVVADTNDAVAGLRAATEASIGSVLEQTGTSVLARMDLAYGREIDLSQMAETLSERLTWLTLQLSQSRTDMADAGIYIDAETGRARLEALARFDNAISEVTLLLDAMQAQINLRATYSDVTYAITNAQIDPADLPELEDFRGRLSTAEATVSGLLGSVSLKADTITLDGVTSRVTQAEADIDSLEGEIALRVTTAELSALDVRVSDAEVTLNALDQPSLTLAVRDARAAIEQDDEIAISLLRSLVQGDVERDLARADLSYARQDMQALVDEDRGSIATLRTEIGAAFGQAVSLIEAERQARADGQTAAASDLLALRADLDSAVGGLVEERQIRLDADGALASRALAIETVVNDPATGLAITRANVQTLDATVNTPSTGLAARFALTEAEVSDPATGLSATRSAVQAQSTAIATLEGRAEATYTLRLNAGGATPVFEIVAADDPVTGPVAAFRMSGGSLIVDGNTFLADAFIQQIVARQALIQDLRVTTLMIGQNAVTIPVYLSWPGIVRPLQAPGSNIGAGAIRREGYATAITFGCQFGASNYAEAIFQIKRNGTTIHEFSSGTGPLGAAQSVYSQFVDPDPGTGITNYRVDCIWHRFAQPMIWQRSLHMVQTKR